MNQPSAQTPSRLLAFLQLGRIPNVFTALADVMMGHIFVRGGFTPGLSFAALLVASASLYTAGMVLNDVFDLEVDRQERPGRPLPSGRVSLTAGRNIGWSLLIFGWLCAVASGWLAPSGDRVAWVSVVIGSLLAMAIVAYDGVLKKTPIGPFSMGLCRTLNVLLGMSAAPVDPAAPWLQIWGPAHLCVAGGLGIYVAGVTWFGRGEAGTSERWRLASGLVIMVAGWVVVAMFPSYLPHNVVLPIPSFEVWYFLLLMLAAPLIRRCWFALRSLDPRAVQIAVKQGIWTIVWLDAAVVIAIGPPIYSLALVALFVPMLFLGRWVYST